MADSLFKTPSLDTACYFIQHNFEFVGVEPIANEPHRFVFIFVDRNDREAVMNQFLMGRGGQVDVHRFLDAQKRLKNLLHEQRRGGTG